LIAVLPLEEMIHFKMAKHEDMIEKDRCRSKIFLIFITNQDWDPHIRKTDLESHYNPMIEKKIKVQLNLEKNIK
jgi:hypothetical protein